jgi:hypothetical protein
MSPFAVDYWLERCEGFRVDVDTPEGCVGFVEAVLVSAETGRAATLLVRGRTPSGLVAVAVDEIVDVALDEEHIVLRRPPSPEPRPWIESSSTQRKERP